MIHQIPNACHFWSIEGLQRHTQQIEHGRGNGATLSRRITSMSDWSKNASGCKFRFHSVAIEMNIPKYTIDVYEQTFKVKQLEAQGRKLGGKTSMKTQKRSAPAQFSSTVVNVDEHVGRIELMYVGGDEDENI